MHAQTNGSPWNEIDQLTPCEKWRKRKITKRGSACLSLFFSFLSIYLAKPAKILIRFGLWETLRGVRNEIPQVPFHRFIFQILGWSCQSIDLTLCRKMFRYEERVTRYRHSWLHDPYNSKYM